MSYLPVASKFLVTLVFSAIVTSSCSSAETSEPSQGSGAATTSIVTTTTEAEAPEEKPETPWSTEVLDLTGDTSTEWPIAGLNSILLSDDASRLVTFQNGPDNTIVLRSFPYAVGQPLTPNDGHVFMKINHPFVHSGGGMVFDSNGDLLVAIGAFLRPSEPLGPQNPDGSIIRVPGRFLQDPNAGLFEPEAKDVIARGLRNPWKMSRDPATGNLWVADVGGAIIEEINLISLEPLVGDAPNYGWPYFESITPVVAPAPESEAFVPPIYSYERDDTTSAIIGGPVYRSDNVTGLEDQYIFSDYLGQKLLAIPLAGGVEEPLEIVGLPANPTSIATNSKGVLYVLSVDGYITEVIFPNGTVESAVTNVLRSMWRGAPNDPTANGTSILVEPGDGALLVSDRRGHIIRVVLDETKPEFCALDIDEIPQLWALGADALETKIPYALEQLGTFGDAFPPRFDEAVQRSKEAYVAFNRLGDEFGWDSQELIAELRLASVERGVWSDIQRQVSLLINFRSDRC